MFKPKPTIFAVAVAVATLAPAASASAGFGLSNHNETLLLDVSPRLTTVGVEALVRIFPVPTCEC